MCPGFGSPSKTKSVSNCLQESSQEVLPHLEGIPDPDVATDDDIVNTPLVQRYKNAVSALHNEEEDLRELEKYKQVSIELLLGKKAVAV